MIFILSNCTISYYFRAIVADDTTTTPFVFFSPNADVVPNIKCSKLVKEQGYSNPKEIPPALEAIKGKRHIFQFHFNQSSKKGIVEFVFDAFLDSPRPGHLIYPYYIMILNFFTSHLF